MTFIATKLFHKAGEGSGGGGGDQHNLGWYATESALTTAHATASDGDWAIVGATDTVWVWDTDTSAWVDTDTKGEVTPDMIIVKSATMPTASTTQAGAVYQYVGASDANYTHGYIYENVATTTSSSATASQTTGSSLSDVAVVLATFETQITTSGSYAFTSDGSDWSYDGNVVDLTDYGITYTGTPVADDVITVVYTESSTTYAWTRIDVQPSPNPLPSQTGNSGKFLTTDGTDASWSDKPLVNTATGTDSLTILGTATTSNLGGINIGSGSSVTGTGIAIGKNSSGGALAIGYGANCGGYSYLAIGRQANAGNSYGTAIGENSKATGNTAMAIGFAAEATASTSLAIGGGAKSTANYAIQIGGVNMKNDEANTMKIGLGNSPTQNYKLLDSDGTIPSDRLVHAINKYSSMPTAASTNEGWIVQYTGTTDSTYTHGHLYECVSDGGNPATYSWTEVSMGGGSGLPSQTGNSGKFLTTDGTDASWSDKPLVNTATGNYSMCIGQTGSSASGQNSLAVGFYAQSTQRSVAVGAVAVANVNYTVAVGDQAGCYGGQGAVALGSAARANAANAIQISATNNVSVNSDANTFKVANANGNFEIMDANGNLPADRLASTTGLADGNYRLRLTMTSGVPSLSWVAE